MYLKSLEIQGFKSFANKIYFKFHNGITGIVGPNGSGKSNVGDAVRWVLGEQSAKQLRGANMQDVIFAGTENRKPLGYASVAITLDNADHQLPIDYQEVTVTRRVYRSGESEYLLNGTACRLKDINELFYDTGIGKEGYSIIGQGQIDKILSGKPEERRELFDEAAGIVKFKRRKSAAQKKLEDERQNLVRVNDILSELTRQLAPLERQAEQARIYLQKKEELKKYEINMFLIDMERLSTQLLEAEKNLDIAGNHLHDVKKEYENTRTEYEKAENEMEELEAAIEEIREKSNRSRLVRQQLSGQIEVLKEQIKTARLNESHMRERKDAILREIAEKETQKEHETRTLQELEVQLEKAQEAEEDSRYESDATAAALSHLERQIEEGKNSIIGLLNQRASVKGKIQRYDAMQEQMQIRKAEVTNKLLRLGSEDAEQGESLQHCRQVFDEVSAEIENLLEQSGKYGEQVNEIQETLTRQNSQMEQGQSAYHREASRLETLINITERYDGYGNSIRKVMEQRVREPGILGVVADLIKVEKSYETAIETALGGSIQNIVTDNEDTAKRMITFLKKNRFGRATFLPLTAVSRKSSFQNEAALGEKGIIGVASSLVHTEEKYRGLTEYLLGRTLVADHIDHAIAVAKKYHYSLRIVTLDGESFSPGGSMTGGAFKNSSNLLGRRREMEELRKSIQMLKRELDEMQVSIDENRQKRNVLRQRIVELNEKLQSCYIKQNTARMEIQQLEDKRNESRGELVRLKAESADMDAQVNQLEEEKSRIREALLESERIEHETQNQIEQWQKEQESERAAQEAQSARAEALHLELANAKQKEEFAKQNLKRISGEIQGLKEELSSVLEKGRDSEQEASEKDERIHSIQNQIDESEASEQHTKERLTFLQAQKEEKGSRQKQFFRQREELSEKMAALDKENFRLNAQKEKLLERKDTQINYLWDEYQIAPSEASGGKSEDLGDFQTVKKHILDLKTEIKGLGNVNVNAIEDYKEMSQRHAFLSGQQDDLVKAEQALLEIITELDEGMRKQFKESFVKIQSEFDKAFKELFGGGKGTLELVEDEDILEAGIRIISQPPGKKLQNMMQLSGGEKALTAIALLFAIQHLKPSPFCLLDEIEAALDEANVARYAKYLHKLTKNTQFIIITHRRGTMAAADRLYGITMQEKGVSALVSVNLIEDDLEQ